jgi:hypothetical protein
VGCVAEFERYSVKTMKKDLLKKLSPRPATVAKQREDTAPANAEVLASSSGASPMESRCLAERNHSASVPLRGKPFEINGSSGSAE